MKRGFGVFFIIIGILNLIIGFLGLATEYKSEAFSKIVFSLVALPLGIWMYQSSEPKEVEIDYKFKSLKLKKLKKKHKKDKKNKKSEFPLKKDKEKTTKA